MNSISLPSIEQKSFIEQIADWAAPRLRERRELAERLANVDVLTDLPNRRAFDLAADTAQTEGKMFILFDCNFFGKINKIYSHKEGDKALKYFAEVLECVARKYKCRAFRYGSGDEFVMIVPKSTAYEIRDAVELRAMPLHYVGFTVSISGEVGADVEEADSKLQARKAIRKGV